MDPKLKMRLVIRSAGLLLLLVSFIGPWFTYYYWTTEETCAKPNVRLGCYTSRVLSINASVVNIISGGGAPWFLLLPTLPYLSTLLLFLIGEEPVLERYHRAAWAFAAVTSLTLAFQNLTFWGPKLGVVVAGAMLAWEKLDEFYRLD